jgi:hypothetical protein
MLFPFTRVWTRRQKGLIVGSVVFGLASFAALIYGYERYSRGPGQEILYGTWHSANCIDCTFDLTFFPDHTFISSGEGMGRYWIDNTGKWYADFNRILLFPDRRDVDEPALGVIKLAGVADNELKVDFAKGIMIYERRKTMTREEIQSLVDKAD